METGRIVASVLFVIVLVFLVYRLKKQRKG
jgi:hypothetical protein